MVAMLGHRGPDGYGLYRDRHLGLAHARLSLVDLEGGFQPLSNGDGTLWLCFNGEIFNYVELRRQLAALGHRFRTQGDSEVIVHAYERWGERAWAMFNGQFAFALWDSRKRLLWLVRDRLGILPLMWSRREGAILFASEAKALFAGGRIHAELSPDALAEAFTTWSVPAPRTPFAGVNMVRPGMALCFDAGLAAVEQRYWRPDPYGLDLTGLSPDEAADGLEERLEQAVRLRLRADVPVGCYVSGGLDSAVVGSMARRLSDQPPHTFGIRFSDPRFDETEEQRRVVAHLGTRHHDFVCDGAAIRDALPEVIWHCETPLLRTAPVPLFLLSARVRDAGMRTVLTGEGADELLAGYTIFKEDQIRRFWARRPDSTLRPALLGRIHHYVGEEDERSTGLWRGFFAKRLEETGAPFYSHLVRWANTSWTLRLLSPEIRRGFDLDRMMDMAALDMPEGWRGWDPLTRAQWTEVHSFMTPYLLSCQGDRVAMAHGVEARYPFLDPDVVDYCLALPKRHKLMGLRDKLALRRVAARHLPASVWGRRKQPFRAPTTAALFGPDSGWPEALLAELPDLPLVDGEAARKLVERARRGGGEMAGEREEMGLVGLLTLALLSRQFGRDFVPRARHARQRLERAAPVVLEDRLPRGTP